MDTKSFPPNHRKPPSFPLEMSLIQPEWIYLSYLDDEKETLETAHVEKEEQTLIHADSSIIIHIRSRK
ncbi:hypothetical protein [Seinonella peptonophila]|uniref:hypothetical protein n=1 Tax=Seinonella peptonophila TaxID=112248 RepID=UPI0009347F07|nr:hypothetical protein [Seinonella peptonophila]